MNIKRTEILAVIAIGAFAFLLTGYFLTRGSDELISTPAHTFSFTDTKGRTINLEDYRGGNQLILLNFWASWCAPCVKEFPILLDIAKEYEEGIVFIALSSDLEDTGMKNFLTRYDISSGSNIYITHDENQKVTNGLYGAVGLPQTYVIDQNLKIRKKFSGAEWKPESLKNQIKLLLGSIKNAS